MAAASALAMLAALVIPQQAQASRVAQASQGTRTSATAVASPAGGSG